MYKLVFILLLLPSVFLAQSTTFSKSYDIIGYSDNGVKTIKVDTLLITHSITGCDFDYTTGCGGIICTDLEGNLQWTKYQDGLSYWGNDGVQVVDGIIYSALFDKQETFSQQYMVSQDLLGNFISKDTIHVTLNKPQIRSIIKSEDGWVLNIIEELSEQINVGALVWVDENYHFIKKVVYSDSTSSFWVDEVIDLGSDGFLVSGAYNTPEWAQEHSLIKLDSEAAVEWAFALPPPYELGFARIAMATDGNVLVSYPMFDFWGTPVGYNPSPYTIQKVTPDGTVLWRHIFWHMGDRRINEFFIAENNDIIGVGSDSYDDDTTNTKFGFIFRMSQDGELLWQRSISDDRFGDNSNYFSNGIELENGDFVFSGRIVDTTDIEALSKINTWLVRTDANGCLYDTCEDITYVTSTKDLPTELSAFQLRPNITKDQVRVYPMEGISQQGWTIRLFNLAGQEILEDQVPYFPYELSVNRQPPGIYFLRMENQKGQFQVLKLIKY